MWFSNKVERAVARLEQEDPSQILCYFAAYQICDEQLRVQQLSAPARKELRFRDTLFEVCGLEFTMAINQKALRFLNENKPQKAKARGTWMCMLFSAFGKIIYDNEPCAYYRRHTSAVTSSNMSFWGMWRWRCKTFFGGGFDEYRLILNDFKHVVGEKLSVEDAELLRLFTQTNSFPAAVRKVFYPHRLRKNMVDELGLRFAFLLGKL